MKRIVLDQGLAPRVAEILNEAGWDAVHVSTINLDRAEDSAILDYSAQTDRTCVTFDHDFHTHLAMSRAGKPSVVLLREEGLVAAQQATLIAAIWDACEEAVEAGAAVSASSSSIRIRPLPLR